MAWQTAWDDSKSLTDPAGRAVGDATLAYLSQFEAYLGRKETLEPLLTETRTRPVHGTAAELVSESSRGLADMLARPELAFKCGPSALARILASQPTSASGPSRQVLDMSRSTPNGLSLSAVQGISVEANMNYQMAFRSPGAQVVIPAVAHWKVGHYAALLGKDRPGRYWIADPTFGEDILLTASTLDEEASGYFLVPQGNLPEGWRRVDALEGNTVWGRGDTGSNHDNGATGAQEPHAFQCGPGGGCSSWNVEAMVSGLSLHDDPIGYTPPLGPAIRFPMDYSHRDTQQPMQFMYTNFGNKWTSGWLSYVTAHAGCDGFYGSESLGVIIPGGTLLNDMGQTPDCALLYRRGGGTEPYAFPPTTGNNTSVEQSALGQFSQAVLTEFVDTTQGPTGFQATTGFWRTLPDGSVEKFTLQMGASNQFFMTEVDDPQGNAVTITYDNLFRIVALTDAIGQVTTICYNDSWPNVAGCSQPSAANGTSSNSQVIQVADPFGRSAYFTYSYDFDPLADAGAGTTHLHSITDVLGITSTFDYQPGSDFVQFLLTPYGQSHFAFVDSTTDSTVGATRSVTLTDPLNRVSYVEFHQGDMTCSPSTASGDAATADSLHIPCSEKTVPAMPIPLNNDLLQFRNTFVWDPYQYSLCSGPSLDYTCAKVIHWAHTNDTNIASASRVPESTKEPLEHRVWFNYENQQFSNWVADGAVGVGSTNQPTAIGRVLDDGSTQLSTYTYNAYGKATQITDPIGRQLTLTYDTNGLDLLTVRNTTPTKEPTVYPSYNDLLLTLADYNSQHEPGTVTGANGQTTALYYNGSGQLTFSTDPNQNTWTYLYDDRGYLRSVTGPAAPEAPIYALGYDMMGRIKTFTDPVGGTVTYSYDSANRLTQTVFADQTSEQFSYQLLDLVSTTDRLGHTTTRGYDADRELTSIVEPAGRTTVLQYWPDGRLNTIQDPRGFVTTTNIDIQGRAEFVIYPDNTETFYIYDGAGRISNVGLPSDAAVAYSFNADNTVSAIQPSSSTDGGALSTFFDYDPAYRRAVFWEQASQRATLANNVVAQSSEVLTYYPVTSPPSLGANRLQRDRTYQTYVPPPTGLISRGPSPTPPIKQSVTESSYTYDALDRVVTHTLTPVLRPIAESSQQSIIQSWTYDALGRTIGNTNALDRFVYGYSGPTPRIQSIKSVAGPQVQAEYYPPRGDDLLKNVVYATTGGTALAEYAYQYDAKHNVTQFAETYPASGTAATTYAYDVYNQLTQTQPAFSAQGDLNTYAYDRGGNRATTAADIELSFGFLTGLELQFSSSQTNYGPTNDMTTSSTTRFLDRQATTTTASYDANGDLLSASAPVYSYDQLGRLIQVSSGAQSSLFTYDGLSRLVQVVDEVAERPGLGFGARRVVVADHSYSWCGIVRCVEVDNTRQIRSLPQFPNTVGSPDRAYFAQGMVTYSQWPPTGVPTGAPAYYVTDALGSVRQLVGPTSGGAPSIIAQYEYDPYGNQSKVAGGNGLDSDRGFAGYFYHASTGLNFAQSRVYNPQLGRWLTRDPIGSGFAFANGAEFSATDLNLYAYAGNNPTTMGDPSGNCPQCMAAGAVIGGVTFGVYYAFTAPTNLTWGQFASGAASAIGQGALLGALAATGAGLAVEASPFLVSAVAGGVTTAVNCSSIEDPADVEAALGDVGSFSEGAASTWNATLQNEGSTAEFLNVETNVTADEFVANLTSNGFTVTNQGPSTNGTFTVLSNGLTEYALYTATSTAWYSVQVTNAAGVSAIKYRLGQ